MKTSHLLMTSVGRRTKLVEYFVREMPNGHVSTADCSPLAPGLYMTERHHLVPGIDAPDYIDHLLRLCQREQVTALLSLIDPELELLAAATEQFEASVSRSSSHRWMPVVSVSTSTRCIRIVSRKGLRMRGHT